MSFDQVKGVLHQPVKAWLAGGILLIVAAGSCWWFLLRSQPLIGFVSGNGRLEAQEIDIATKFQGRVAEVLVDEGDAVRAGEVLARMDTKSLQAQLREAQARVIEARAERTHAAAVVRQRDSECRLAQKQLERSMRIHEREPGAISADRLDRDRAAVETAQALCRAAEADLATTEAAIQAKVAETERLQADIKEGALLAPRGGRVLYRLAEPGEVLPAGGKILTIIDLSDVYMDIFLSTGEAGKIRIGADARILLDALPDRPIPARVSFVAPKAQFTPKEVETRTQREKLVFRVKIQVRDGEDPVFKPGMPGLAFIRTDEYARWPDDLR